MISKSIPLSKLYARSAEKRHLAALVGTGYITELGNSILKMGVLNPLTVQLPHASSKGAWYRVIDGTARLEALKTLALQGKIPKDYEVPCMVYTTAWSDAEITEHRAHSSPGYQHLLHQKKIIAKALKQNKFYEPNRQLGKTLSTIVAMDMETEGKPIVVMYADGHVAELDRAYLESGSLYEHYMALRGKPAYEPAEDRMHGDGFDKTHLLRQSERRSWRIGSQPATITALDWAAVEIRLAQKYAAICTNFRHFDLGDQW